MLKGIRRRRGGWEEGWWKKVERYVRRNSMINSKWFEQADDRIFYDFTLYQLKKKTLTSVHPLSTQCGGSTNANVTTVRKTRKEKRLRLRRWARHFFFCQRIRRWNRTNDQAPIPRLRQYLSCLYPLATPSFARHLQFRQWRAEMKSETEITPSRIRCQSFHKTIVRGKCDDSRCSHE